MQMEQAITERSIRGLLRGTDFKKHTALQNKAYLNLYIDMALSCAQSPERLPIKIDEDSKVINGKKKHVFSTPSFIETLLLRSISKNLASVLPKNKDRKHITREIKEHLKWGPQRLLLKLDIKTFYQSFKNDFVREVVENEHRLSIQTRALLMKYLEWYWSLGHEGLPQGLQFSNPLAELCMVDFDTNLRAKSECLYYCRFVDDILIVMSSKLAQRKQVLRYLKQALPSGLTLNGDKQLLVEVKDKFAKGEHVFDYLGYKHIITGEAETELTLTSKQEKFKHNKYYRKTKTLLSVSKCKKLKNRIYKAFHSFVSNGDIELLYDRIDYLTSSRVSGNKKQMNLSGLYYDNAEITDFDDLRELDKFLNGMINGGFGTLSGKIKLTRRQRNNLSNKSFYQRFRSKYVRRFSYYRRARMLGIWRSEK
ncbi:antiviral reverse transcriptase Drt3a [Pseudidiomarina gelatinasegens]|uniref:antiviral reverse transcriptase Drt3a n=1 Tax=Pseudidiomarina gelatinasegens TaxID=2487740 RepID=UPI003A976D23